MHQPRRFGWGNLRNIGSAGGKRLRHIKHGRTNGQTRWSAETVLSSDGKGYVRLGSRPPSAPKHVEGTQTRWEVRMNQSNLQPPVIAIWLIDLLIPEAQKESVKGDLLEEFSDLATKCGESSARSWYWRHSRKTVARLMFRTPWVVAIAVFGASFAVMEVVGFFVLQQLNIDGYVPPTELATDLLLLAGTGTLVLLVASVIVAMLARGKEVIATVLFGLTFQLVVVAADLIVHRDAILLTHPTFLIVNSLLIGIVGVFVRRKRLKAERRLLRG